MEKAKGRDKIFYASIVLLLSSFINIFALCYLVRFITPLSTHAVVFDKFVLYGVLSALIFQLLVIVGAISGLILCNAKNKYQILMIFGICLQVLATLITITILPYAYIMMVTLIALTFYIKGAYDNKLID